MNNPKDILKDKIMSLDALKAKVDSWREDGDRIVFSNGVFDLLHKGHITYLLKAKELGDRLIIGSNSDSSVKRLKGDKRPINNQDCRATLLAALFFIDAVTVFKEDTPLNLITIIKPNILVKGADYKLTEIVGTKEVLAYGGEVKTIDLLEGFSSTSLIAKIKRT